MRKPKALDCGALAPLSKRRQAAAVQGLRLIIAALTLASALQAQDLPSVTLPPALDRVLRDYERAWTARDAAGLAALFTEDGFVLSPNKPPVRGRDAIRAAYTGAGGPLYLRALAYKTDGSVGYIIGAFGHAKGGGDDGKFNLALRRVKGRWLIAADMDNSNRRPGPPPQ